MRVISEDGGRCLSVKATIQRLSDSTGGWKRQRTEFCTIFSPQCLELNSGLVAITLLWNYMLSPPACLSEPPLQ